MNIKLLCFTVLLAGCGAHVRDALAPASPEPENASWETSEVVDAQQSRDPFTGNGSGVRRIDAALP